MDEPNSALSATDLTLIIEDRVGTLAETLAILGEAGVSVLGHGGFPAWAGEGVLHLIVDDVDRAQEAFSKSGVEIREQRDVVVVPVADAPGSLASMFQRISSANVNIDLTYALADGRVAIGVDSVSRAMRALRDDSG